MLARAALDSYGGLRHGWEPGYMGGEVAKSVLRVELTCYLHYYAYVVYCVASIISLCRMSVQCEIEKYLVCGIHFGALYCLLLHRLRTKRAWPR